VGGFDRSLKDMVMSYVLTNYNAKGNARYRVCSQVTRAGFGN
jgi:hypothetical protein